MQIGVVAELTEVSIQTLRHWEKVGLVEPSARSAGGFRLYTAGDVERLRTIRRMKPLGFALEDMKALLDALDTLGAAASPPDHKAEAEDVLSDCAHRVDDSIDTLRRHLAYAEELSTLLGARTPRAEPQPQPQPQPGATP